MSDVHDAESVTLRNRKPLAPPFHKHIAKSKLMNQTCRVGDTVLIYEITATEPLGDVQVNQATQFLFE
jgi:hypothetical protein